MNRPLTICCFGVLFSVAVLSFAQFCSGCATSYQQTPLMAGDTGPCTTVLLARQPDGGFTTSLVPCDFTGK